MHTSLDTIIPLLLNADDAYFNGEIESPLSDAEYDALKLTASKLDPAHSYFTGVGSEVRGGKVKLPHQMGSLNQAHTGECSKWIETNSLLQETFVVSDKMDGMSVLIVLDNSGQLQIAYSRGDGKMGADITRHVRRLNQAIRATTSLKVRAELIIPVSKFANLLGVPGIRVYKNPRNAIAGIMNSSAPFPKEVYECIDIVAYEIVSSSLSKSDQLATLADVGFKTVPYTLLTATDLTDATLTELVRNRKAASDHELDGVVIDVNSSATRSKLLTDELNPVYAVKYKIVSESNQSTATVRDVEIAISKDGYLKPTVWIHPIELCGVTISKCTGFNMSFIKNNRLTAGSTVTVTRAGDVIPVITNVLTSGMDDETFAAWFLDKTSKYGETEWTVSSANEDEVVDLRLTNADGNDTVIFERLNHFFSSIDVPHLGEGNLQKIVDGGIKTIEDIIKLPVDQMAKLIGSEIIAKRITDGMTEKLSSIPAYILMGSHSAFGRGVGKRKFKLLWDAFGGDMTKCKDADVVTTIRGFDEITANKIAAGYNEFQSFLDSISEHYTLMPYQPSSVGELSGNSYVITGFRDSELEELITSMGGKMSTSVSKNTTVVIAADPMDNSTKLKKAGALNIPVMTKQQFITRYN